MNVSTLLSIARARLLAKPVPVAVGFELTHVCNLSCQYCDRHQRLPNEMTLPQIFAALQGLIEIGMKEISLDGGEALAHPHITEVVQWLAERQVIMRLNTNGVLVPKRTEVIRRMQKVKISLDGPPEVHDAIRGRGAFAKAARAISVAHELGVAVELTCAVGRHNAHTLRELIGIAEQLQCAMIFQPVRPSLFSASGGCAEPWVLSADESQRAFAEVESFKREGRPVLNGWASLRHFRHFPKPQGLPCAAGWINVTLDPEGQLYHCGQVDRSDRSNNVVQLGVAAAFARLKRDACQQCWCARVVEENYAWGGRFDLMLPPLAANPARPQRSLPVLGKLSTTPAQAPELSSGCSSQCRGHHEG